MIDDSSIRLSPRPQELARMTTAEIRDAFLVPSIYQTGGLHGLFTDLDRLVVAGAVAAAAPLELPNHIPAANG